MAEHDPRIRAAESRRVRVAGLFSGNKPVDLDALVRARSLDGAGGQRTGINARFATATVQQAFQANRRAQVSCLWESHASAAAASDDRGGGASAGDWPHARQSVAEREQARQARLAAARAEEDRLQRLEDEAAAQRCDGDGACAPTELPVLKRGRGSVGAVVLSGSEASDDPKEEERKSRDKKHKREKHKHKHKRHRRSRSRE